MKCKHWQKVPDNFGSEPQCAFDKKGFFIKSNWNCSLISDLLTLYEDDFTIVYNWDERCKVLAIEEDIEGGDFLILSQYKNRGKIQGAFVLEGGIVKRFTEKLCLKMLGVKHE